MKNNYLVIQGFMVSELNLSGNDLLTYALIYGFSQDGETEFTGSINYLCKWLNCSRPTAIKSLKFLTEKSLIVKSVNTINGVNFNRYKISLGVVKNLNWGSKETLPNNTTINNTNNNIDIILPKNKFSEDVYKVFEHTVVLFKEAYRPVTESQKNNWLDCIEKLNRIDGIDFREIYKIAKWGLQDDFWSKNFYTILKLRKKNSEGILYATVFKSQMPIATSKTQDIYSHLRPTL
jgi:hypothetical protein